ncbi:MAG: OmpA family protein [Deltaproteobacteria bacterium]|jgi:outer membrane protein OmpA-like peptidoglycan-associated protein|nr:OmpA family protein [Deltaproteobacteria bacterium]
MLLFAPRLPAMTNHHDYFPYGWYKPVLYGSLRVKDEMIDFDPAVEGEETRREEFILPNEGGRVYRLSHNGRVFCYVADHDLADPWDFQIVDYDGSGAFEYKEPPFSEMPLPLWTFINYPFRYVNARRFTDLTDKRDPSVEDMIRALAGGPRRKLSPAERAALAIANGGNQPEDLDDAPRLALNILFDFDKDTLTPDDVRVLHTLGKAMTSPELAGRSFKLEGHTDAKGTHEYNMGLSQRRADRVQAFLMENYGIGSWQLVTEAYGKTRPLPNLDPTNGRNRRVEIVNVGRGYMTDQGAYSAGLHQWGSGGPQAAGADGSPSGGPIFQPPTVPPDGSAGPPGGGGAQSSAQGGSQGVIPPYRAPYRRPAAAQPPVLPAAAPAQAPPAQASPAAAPPSAEAPQAAPPAAEASQAAPPAAEAPQAAPPAGTPGAPPAAPAQGDQNPSGNP